MTHVNKDGLRKPALYKLVKFGLLLTDFGLLSRFDQIFF